MEIFSTGTGWETFTTCQRFTSTAFAMKAASADMASDADALDGKDSGDLLSEVDNKIDEHASDPSVHHTKTTRFSELTDMAKDAQIPNDITVNYAQDADKVDGKHASEFGDGHSLDADDGDPVDAVYVNESGNVGIGTTTPIGRLDVGGGDPIVDPNNGNIGINMANPEAKLDVNGSVYFEGGDGDIDFDGKINLGDILSVVSYLYGGILFNREQLIHADVDGDGRVTWDDLGMIYIMYFGLLSKYDAKRKIHAVYGTVNDSTFFVNGNVGIGTMDPTEKLEVDGTVKATAFVGDGSGISGISSESFAMGTSKPVIASYSPGFGDPGLITDGVFAPEGTGWSDPNYAVKLDSADYSMNLKIDLGAIYSIYRLRVQADNNDSYKVEYSMDDTAWNTFYDVPMSTGGGLRTRDSSTLTFVKARYLRIYAVSGDNAYSVSEVEVYAYGINIANSGNVGIGTTNPVKPLEVMGSDERGIVKLSFSGNDRYISLGGDWPYIDSYGTGARLLLNFNSSQDIDIGNGDLYIVNSSGNVGIGTTNPGAKLTISNSTSNEYGQSSIFVSSNNSYFDFNAGLVFRGTGNLWSARFTSTNEMNPDGEILGIYKEEPYSGFLGESVAVFKNNGNVGIGTGSPEALFQVFNTRGYPDGGLTARFNFYSDPKNFIQFSESFGARIDFSRPNDGTFHIRTSTNGSTFTERLTFHEPSGNIYMAYYGGNVGIGTNNPRGKLDVNGPIYQRGSELHADYVFKPGYKLESIEAHAAFMWKERHLKAIPKATVDEKGQEIIDVGSHRKGIVEELEKAHIYIEQLHKRIEVLEEELTILKEVQEKLAKLEAVINK